MPSALLISTYDLGRQPFGLASPAAWLRDAGVDVVCTDLSKEPLPEQMVRSADVVGLFLPMHTATRLALPVIDRIRALNPRARLAAYGLYAPLNAALLRERGITDILGGEFEADLVDVVRRAGLSPSRESPADGRPPSRRIGGTARPSLGGAAQPSAADADLKFRAANNLPRLDFRVPARDGLPPLTRYAALQTGSERVIAGYTEASRGCKHRCRHCPIVPVYDGRFRIVPVDVVLADVRAQVRAGARHITFGDPDFFNGIRHAMAVLESFAREFAGVTYDVTIKIEHLLQHAELLPGLRDTGCAFVTSAVESLDDDVLATLEKGHTRADFERVVWLFREFGLTLAPTFVAFSPWTTLYGYADLLQEIDRLELVDHVAPIQLAIRLLLPQGSRLLEVADVRATVTHYDPRWLTHVWRHPDPRVDALQRDVERLVGSRLPIDRRELFDRIWEVAHQAAGIAAPPRRDAGALPRAAIPYLNEPWYC